jgi:hypothetical protein
MPEFAKRTARPRGWSDVLDALYDGSWNAGLQRFRSPFAFRGLSRVDHTLSSSLVRLAVGRADPHRLEVALLRNFRKYAHTEVPHAESVWDWLAIGQHRGLPTRLLDWTYSPLVALHFATDTPADFDSDAVIWCVNFVEANKRLPRRLRRIMTHEGSETVTAEMLSSIRSLRQFDALSREPFLVFMEPPAIDRRILNQFALFSLMSSPSANMDDWLREHPALCRCVVVPAALKWEIRDKLDQANINERILFPDLDGLSRWLARYYQPLGSARLERPGRHDHDNQNARDRNRAPGRPRRAAARRATGSKSGRR